MKHCDNCKYAEWRRTAAGKLHPIKLGRCTYPIRIPALPQAFYFIGDTTPLGGMIERGRELRDHCVYFAPKDAP